jgi:hypothetical protein
MSSLMHFYRGHTKIFNSEMNIWGTSKRKDAKKRTSKWASWVLTQLKSAEIQLVPWVLVCIQPQEDRRNEFGREIGIRAFLVLNKFMYCLLQHLRGWKGRVGKCHCSDEILAGRHDRNLVSFTLYYSLLTLSHVGPFLEVEAELPS